MIYLKNCLFIFVLIVLLILISNVVTNNDLIPEDAIRIRVVANSNDNNDQDLKQEIRKDVEKYLYQKLDHVDNIKDADLVIKDSIPNVRKIVNQYTTNYRINYGMNYFPEKEYKGITYKEGEYNSLVITLGNGLGDNWWCVLFPPLCLLEGEESTEVEYHSYVVDTLNKYLK